MRISDWSSDVCSSDLYAEKNDGLRKFLSERYGHVLRDFARAIATCVPELSKEQLYWRLDFLADALTYAMADFGLIQRLSGDSDNSHRSKDAQELIRFAAPGLQIGRAPGRGGVLQSVRISGGADSLYNNRQLQTTEKHN